MSRKTVLISIAAVALAIAAAASSAQAGDNLSAAAGHAAARDKGVKGSLGATHPYFEGYGRSLSTTGLFNPDIRDENFEGYPRPK